MRIAQPPDRRRAARMLALAWVALALAFAGLQSVQAASALGSGLIHIPWQKFAWLHLSRTGEPMLFHAALVGTMLLALASVESARRVWKIARSRFAAAHAQRTHSSERC